MNSLSPPLPALTPGTGCSPPGLPDAHVLQNLRHGRPADRIWSDAAEGGPLADRVGPNCATWPIRGLNSTHDRGQSGAIGVLQMADVMTSYIAGGWLAGVSNRVGVVGAIASLQDTSGYVEETQGQIAAARVSRATLIQRPLQPSLTRFNPL
jgi:hypothetical protein